MSVDILCRAEYSTACLSQIRIKAMHYVKTSACFFYLCVSFFMPAVASFTPGMGFESDSFSDPARHIVPRRHTDGTMIRDRRDWHEQYWQAGDVTFVDKDRKPLPFSHASIKNGELFPLGRFCVKGESFPPVNYNPLTDRGYYAPEDPVGRMYNQGQTGKLTQLMANLEPMHMQTKLEAIGALVAQESLGKDVVCGPYPKGTNRRIENGVTAGSVYYEKGSMARFIGYSYQEFFVDKAGLFHSGYKVWWQREFILDTIQPGANSRVLQVINDFILSRDMMREEFMRGLKANLGEQRYSAILENYPDLKNDPALKSATFKRGSSWQ